MILEEWMKRELDEVYVSTIIVKETVYKRINGIPKKQNIYILMRLNLRGYKKIIDVIVPTEETTGFWYTKISELKSRGVKDILYLSSDGVSGFKEILVSRKQWKELCDDLKRIYKNVNLESATNILEKWKTNKILYKKLSNDIPHLLQLYDYKEEIRKIVYTQIKVESMNSALRKVTNGKGSFVNEQALEKVLYLRIKELANSIESINTFTWRKS